MSWADWRDEIAKAADGSHHTIESIEQSIREGRSYLLMPGDCCFVAEIVEYPKERACQMTWTAGEMAAIKAAAPAVEDWARSMGCTEMLVEGHPGWVRALKELGYSQWSATVRKAL